MLDSAAAYADAAMRVVTSWPFILLGGWLLARGSTVLAVRAKIIELAGKPAYRFTRYVSKRWRQIALSAGTTIVLFGVCVATGLLEPPAAAAVASFAPDKLVSLLSNRYMQGQRPNIPIGTDDNDITQIANDVLSQTTKIDPPEAGA